MFLVNSNLTPEYVAGMQTVSTGTTTFTVEKDAVYALEVTWKTVTITGADILDEATISNSYQQPHLFIIKTTDTTLSIQSHGSALCILSGRLW